MKTRLVQAHRPDSTEYISCAEGGSLPFERRKTDYRGWIWCIDEQGTGAWVPETYVKLEGERCRFLRDYSSRELEVTAGEQVEVLETESGWAWVRDQRGRRGWLPLERIDRSGQAVDSD